MKDQPLFELVWGFTDTIPGSFTRLSGEKYFEQALCGGRVVEVGVDQGRSASLLLAASEINGADVILIDSWESLLIENKTRVEKLLAAFPRARARIVHARSVEAAGLVEGSFNLIHIDANHYDDNPANDCKAWLPRLVKGGVACFHDYGPGSTFPAVTEAVDRYTKGWEHLGDWDGLAIRRKV